MKRFILFLIGVNISFGGTSQVINNSNNILTDSIHIEPIFFNLKDTTQLRSQVRNENLLTPENPFSQFFGDSLDLYYYKAIKTLYNFNLDLIILVQKNTTDIRLELITSRNEEVISTQTIFELKKCLHYYNYIFSGIINDTLIIIDNWRLNSFNVLQNGTFLTSSEYNINPHGEIRLITKHTGRYAISDSLKLFYKPQLSKINTEHFNAFLKIFPMVDLPIVIDEKSIKDLLIYNQIPFVYYTNYSYLKTIVYSIYFKSDSVSLFAIGRLNLPNNRIACIYCIQYDVIDGTLFNINIAVFNSSGLLEETMTLSEFDVGMQSAMEIRINNSLITNDLKIVKFNPDANRYEHYYFDLYGGLRESY